jgi:hypothetical protein
MLRVATVRRVKTGNETFAIAAVAGLIVPCAMFVREG